VSPKRGRSLDVGALLDQLLEGQALVGRVHGEPLEVLGKAASCAAAGTAIDDEAAHLMVGGSLPSSARLRGQQTGGRLLRR
jgi:predicted RNA-binding Zn ribbon-like protein